MRPRPRRVRPGAADGGGRGHTRAEPGALTRRCGLESPQRSPGSLAHAAQEN
ncbi:hypothetical protein LC55x_1525 [Lysobacter capsici]|nr:hypothetical protein LC55x_1525 [Lysobacter capsici]